MKKIKNNNGFTLVELLAVIVVLAIVMGLAVVGISSVLENTRKSAFAADAKSFLEGAHTLVNNADISRMMGTDPMGIAIDCKTNKTTRYIPLELIPVEQGGKKSPYGNPYTMGSATSATTTAPAGSYIQVDGQINTTTDSPNNGKCMYTYHIFLTDGVYAVEGSTKGSPVEEKDVSNSSVKTALTS